VEVEALPASRPAAAPGGDGSRSCAAVQRRKLLIPRVRPADRSSSSASSRQGGQFLAMARQPPLHLQRTCRSGSRTLDARAKTDRAVLIPDPERIGESRVISRQASGAPWPSSRAWWPPWCPAHLLHRPWRQRPGQRPPPAACAWRPRDLPVARVARRAPCAPPARRWGARPTRSVKVPPPGRSQNLQRKPEHTAFRELASAIVLELAAAAPGPRRAASWITCCSRPWYFAVTAGSRPGSATVTFLDLSAHGFRRASLASSWLKGPCGSFTTCDDASCRPTGSGGLENRQIFQGTSSRLVAFLRSTSVTASQGHVAGGGDPSGGFLQLDLRFGILEVRSAGTLRGRPDQCVTSSLPIEIGNHIVKGVAVGHGQGTRGEGCAHKTYRRGPHDPPQAAMFATFSPLSPWAAGAARPGRWLLAGLSMGIVWFDQRYNVVHDMGRRARISRASAAPRRIRLRAAALPRAGPSGPAVYTIQYSFLVGLLVVFHTARALPQTETLFSFPSAGGILSGGVHNPQEKVCIVVRALSVPLRVHGHTSSLAVAFA